MIGILFIYWIWKSFTNLAMEYDKNKWKYFFIGLVTYYAGTIIFGFIFTIIRGLVNGVDTLGDKNYDYTGWSLFFFLFGGLACYGIYKFLENRAEKQRDLLKKEGIENIGLVEEN